MKIEVKGTKEELLKVIEAVLDFQEGKRECYFDYIKINHTLNCDYITGDIKTAVSNFLENKHEEITIEADGPYGEYDDLMDTGFFQHIASSAQGVYFNGYIGHPDYPIILNAEIKGTQLYLEEEGEDDHGTSKGTAIYDVIKKEYIERNEEYEKYDEEDYDEDEE